MTIDASELDGRILVHAFDTTMTRHAPAGLPLSIGLTLPDKRGFLSIAVCSEEK